MSRLFSWIGVLLALGSVACTARATARLSACRPLHYAPGAAPAKDQTWVRAASGVATRGDALAIVQDDAHFLATIRGDEVTPLSLMRAGEERPLAEDPRVTHGDKLDLESIVSFDGAGARLVAFGSGSAPMRRVIVVLDAGASVGVLHDVAPFFDLLAGESAFAGSELNVEGVVLVDGKLRFFQRGNGAPRASRAPVNATVDVDRDAFVAWIDRGGPLPPLENVQRHDLGNVDGVPLAFTDATMRRGAVIFVAASESSPDVTRDGAVVGVHVGRFGDDGAAETVPIVEPSGRPTTRKVEGLTPHARGDALHAVVDADDPKRAAEICTLELPASW